MTHAGHNGPLGHVPQQRQTTEGRTLSAPLTSPAAAVEQDRISPLAIKLTGIGLTLGYILAFVEVLIPQVIGVPFLIVWLGLTMYIVGIPIELIATHALRDHRITYKERHAMFAWPWEFLHLMWCGFRRRRPDGTPAFFAELTASEDDSDTWLGGAGAWAWMIFSVLLAGGGCLLGYQFALDMLYAVLLGGAFAYFGGMLLYFWAFRVCDSFTGVKTLYLLLTYPGDMFRMVTSGSTKLANDTSTDPIDPADDFPTQRNSDN